MNSDRFSPGSRLRSFKFALRGLLSLLKFEHNSRIHMITAAGVIALGFIFKLKPVEWCLIALSIGIVFITELINSSIEAVSDAVSPEWHEIIMKAKDYAAAGVLIAAIISIVIGAIIFIPRLLLLI